MSNNKLGTENSQKGFIALFATLILLIVAAWLFLTMRPEKSTFEADPTLSYAHGTFYWQEGIAKPDTKYLLDIQQHYILKYQERLNRNDKTQADKVKNSIYAKVSDDVLANALYIDWLIPQTVDEPFSRDATTTQNIRWYYTSTIQDDPLPPSNGGYWTKGISLKLVKELQFEGLDIFAQVDTAKSTYREECIAAGVPVPNKLFDEEWEGNFGGVEKAAGYDELNMYLSEEPQGFCLSLTRSGGPADTEGHIDLICMGQKSSRACFFEAIGFNNNIQGVRDITELYAGNNIPIGDGSAAPCTQCHLGENAFIIHPEDPSFVDALQAKSIVLGNPSSWNATNYYQPFGVPSWPTNPPPLDLSTIPSDKSCSNCHVASYAGRFPNVSQMPDPDLYDAYCNAVIGTTIDDSAATMPLNDLANTADYAGHKNYLAAMCDKKNDGELVDNTFEDDPSFVGPPRIVQPLYQCAQAIYVDSYIDDAQVELVINDIVVSTANPSQFPVQFKFSNISQLEEGDRVQTRQRVNGTWSEYSTPVIASNHKSDYPDGLPAPTIDPSTVFGCASVIAVRYDIPGFDLEVWVNGENPVNAETFAGYVPVKPGKTPFEFTDEFTAQVRACSELSPVSDTVTAQRTASKDLTEAQINPLFLYESQEFINVTNLTFGSSSQVLESNTGLLGSFNTPMSWQIAQLSLPLALSDQLVASQQLCDFSSQPAFTQSPTILSCSALSAPEITAPAPNDNFVRVINPLLGARVRIYDEDSNEIGDGTGSMIPLSRALISGETITAVQQVGDCISSMGYQIEV